MKRYFPFILFIVLSFFPLFIYAESGINAGFIPGQIWYSKNNLIEGESVNIYTAIWNGAKESLSVKVEFYDKNVILGSREVVLVPFELKEVYVPWKITSGDHLISAKIISSLTTVSGKKETVSLDRSTTSADKQFVPVVVKNEKGEEVSGADVFTDKIVDNIPEGVSTYATNTFEKVDDFRDKTFVQVSTVKKETQKEIELLEAEEKNIRDISNGKKDIEDATEKPIAHIKLFLFSALAFIFGNKIIFYGLLIFLIFLILRFFYRKIRNR